VRVYVFKDMASTYSETRRKKEPHIFNLNADLMLTGKVVYFINKVTLTVGSGKTGGADIELK
jgi:hypothetical protein